MDNQKKLLHVSSSPHVRAKKDTATLMKTVFYVLCVPAAFGVLTFGPRALLILVLAVGSSMIFEHMMNVILKRPYSLRDYSAAITGLLIGMNLPVNCYWWLPILGSAFAMIIVKSLFGGLGQNIMNPALGARCFLLISFAGNMCDFSLTGWSLIPVADTVSGATPLAAVKAGESINLMASFIGYTKGTIGETSALLLILGGIYLAYEKIIDLRIPVSYIATFSVFALLYGRFDFVFLISQLCCGGLMLGAWFMATDYVTSPITPNGRILFGICLGLLTGIFRFFGASAEGVSYAIIFCNLLVPLMEQVTIRKAFGRGGKA